MINCTLGDKTYFIDYVSGRALRELQPALEMYGKIAHIAEKATKGEEMSEEDKKININEALDVMVKWFCILFGNQFTVDEVYDKYPVDSLMHDMVVAILAVQSQTTSVLKEFPMKAAQTKEKAV